MSRGGEYRRAFYQMNITSENCKSDTNMANLKEYLERNMTGLIHGIQREVEKIDFNLKNDDNQSRGRTVSRNYKLDLNSPMDLAFVILFSLGMFIAIVVLICKSCCCPKEDSQNAERPVPVQRESNSPDRGFGYGGDCDDSSDSDNEVDEETSHFYGTTTYSTDIDYDGANHVPSPRFTCIEVASLDIPKEPNGQVTVSPEDSVESNSDRIFPPGYDSVAEPPPPAYDVVMMQMRRKEQLDMVEESQV